MNYSERVRNQKIESILNKRVEGEAFIETPPYEWKLLLIRYFNRFQRKEISIDQLLIKLKDDGVVFLQKDSLVKYPVIECLKQIAKVSKKEIELP